MGRISALTELTSLESNDYLIVLDSSANIAKKITVANAFGIPDFGWTAAGESWTYSSFNTTTRLGVVTVPTDATTKYMPDMKIKITQSTGGTKYGRIIIVTATTLTIYFGSSYTLNNEAITSPSYSIAESPYGFDEGKFQVYFQGYRTSSQAIAGGYVDTTVVYTSTHNNDGGGLNTSTGVFTAPIKGIYEFEAQIHWAGAGPTRGLSHWQINGASVSRWLELTMSGAEIGTSGALRAKLNAGDTVSVVVSGASAASLADSSGSAGKGGGEPMFSGQLVRRTT